MVVRTYGQPPPTSYNMERSQINFRTLDVEPPGESRRRNWKMAHLTTKDSPKPRVMDNLLRHGYPASLWPLVLCCPADLQSQSATIRYIIREYGQETIFRLKPSVGTATCLQYSHTAPWYNQIFLLYTRASTKYPLLHETLHACLNHLRHQLHQHQISRVHIPIYDPERSINLLPTWYATLRDHFFGSNLEIVLHDRVYVSIA